MFASSIAHNNAPGWVIAVIIGMVVILYAVQLVFGRRCGYKFGRNTIVRCSKGHVFTSVWIPGASFKSIRLGWLRFQRCPVGKHWSLVRPVKEKELTSEELKSAEKYHDRIL